MGTSHSRKVRFDALKKETRGDEGGGGGEKKSVITEVFTYFSAFS